ncbi:MAG: TonB-dependent receptor, partial [Perlucidibaca sp.]
MPGRVRSAGRSPRLLGGRRRSLCPAGAEPAPDAAARPTATGKLEFGARLEHDDSNPDGSAATGLRFTPFSYSAGSIFNLGEDTHLKATLTHAERAPAAEELYANGPHGATATFERGSTAMRKERANDAELGLDHHRGRLTLEGSIFYKRVRDYIYASEVDGNSDGSADRVDETGALDPAGEFLLVDYRQANASFHGYEAAASYAVLQDGPLLLSARAFTDSVRGQLDSSAGASDRDLPRMTPTRYGISLHGHYGRTASNISLTRVNGQDRIASLETSTKGYNLLNADIDYRLPTTREASVFLRGTNLLDDEIRRAT